MYGKCTIRHNRLNRHNSTINGYCATFSLNFQNQIFPQNIYPPFSLTLHFKHNNSINDPYTRHNKNHFASPLGSIRGTIKIILALIVSTITSTIKNRFAFTTRHNKIFLALPLGSIGGTIKNSFGSYSEHNNWHNKKSFCLYY